MRLTIIAGLIMGLSMAVQSALDARARHSVKAVDVPAKTIAPWYIATSDGRSAGHHACDPCTLERS
jgi:hypothetical protein